MREHIVIPSWLGTEDSSLTLGFFCQSISSRIGDHRGKFIIKRFFFVNMLRVTARFLELKKIHRILVILL